MTDSSANTVEANRQQALRPLAFQSLADVQAECERLAQIPVITTGNWSVGQIFLHLARGIDLSIDGSPALPWLIRFVAQNFLKRKFLTQPMQPGWKLPAKNLLPGETSTEAGLKALQRAIERYELTEQRQPHPAFGALTATEWTTMHCNHAALHLSFIKPAGNDSIGP